MSDREVGGSWPDRVPLLGDGVVTLRAHRADDVHRIVELAHDAESIRWTTIPTPYAALDAEAFVFGYVAHSWDDGSAMTWAIEFEGRFAGTVEFRGVGRIVDVGFSVHPDCRGAGVARRAVTLAVEEVFRAGKQVVQWACIVGNVASLRVAHACGFRLNAMVPDNLEVRGEIRDAWVGALRAGDSFDPKTVWRATTFESDRFLLRPLEERDDERIRETLDDPISRKYLFARPDPLLIEHAAAERTRKIWTAARGETCTWVVADRDADRYLADITMLKIDEVTGAEVGFFTHPDARGSGVLGEAVPASVRHAFDVLGFRRLTLLAADSNKGSKSLATRAGMHYYGTQRLAARSAGVFEDLVAYELLRDDPDFDGNP